MFQGYINYALRGLLDYYVVVYLDDILIYLQDAESHKKHVRIVLERLRRYRLFTKLLKYEFFKRQVGYLRFVVTLKGVEIEAERI